MLPDWFVSTVTDPSLHSPPKESRWKPHHTCNSSCLQVVTASAEPGAPREDTFTLPKPRPLKTLWLMNTWMQPWGYAGFLFSHIYLEFEKLNCKYLPWKVTHGRSSLPMGSFLILPVNCLNLDLIWHVQYVHVNMTLGLLCFCMSIQYCSSTFVYNQFRIHGAPSYTHHCADLRKAHSALCPPSDQLHLGAVPVTSG